MNCDFSSAECQDEGVGFFEDLHIARVPKKKTQCHVCHGVIEEGAQNLESIEWRTDPCHRCQVDYDGYCDDCPRDEDCNADHYACTCDPASVEMLWCCSNCNALCDLLEITWYYADDEGFRETIADSWEGGKDYFGLEGTLPQPLWQHCIDKFKPVSDHNEGV